MVGIGKVNCRVHDKVPLRPHCYSEPCTWLRCPTANCKVTWDRINKHWMGDEFIPPPPMPMPGDAA